MTGRHFRRSAGVLLPVASLPGPGSIGNFGPAAYRFVDWLARAGQRCWQVLPLTIPDQLGSPYASRSSVALNWLLISGELLRRDGWLPPEWKPARSRIRVDYRAAAQEQWRAIRQAHSVFQSAAQPSQRRSFDAWRRRQSWWLDNFVLFQALKDRHRQRPWWQWSVHYRTLAGAQRHLDRPLTRQMELHAFAQWLADRQWQVLHDYARQRGVAVIGDLPFYVQLDSVDVWARRRLFCLDRRGRPTEVAAVPPDGFNPGGQRWGNPVYNWPVHRRQKFLWWQQRFAVQSQRFDLLRFDHWPGLAETYHVRPVAKDARRGRWVKTPGPELLSALKRVRPSLPLVAEDLGRLEPAAERLRRRYGLPSIRVLLFGWSGLPHNIHHPNEIGKDCFYFTSNHDTNTTVGWWRQQARWYEQKHIGEYRRLMRAEKHWTAVDIVYRSRAAGAIVPVQDMLGLGSAARLNRPGTKRGNWRWRLTAGALNLRVARRLRRLARRTRRI